MPDTKPARYRFGVFEADAGTGELRRQGLRVKLHQQPFQLLMLLLARPGEILTRDDISRELWPDGTFVDYEHGVNSAINRLREALGDKASQPRYVETLARRGYRFVAPVERLGAEATSEAVEPLPTPPGKAAPGTEVPVVEESGGFFDRVLATEADLPTSPPVVVRTLFVLLQVMYLGFYVGALANLGEIGALIQYAPLASETYGAIVATAVALIPVRAFLLCGVLFRAPGMRQKYMTLWPYLVMVDGLWALSPFLLLNHINYGVAAACMALLMYSPFAQRSLMLMGAGDTAS